MKKAVFNNHSGLCLPSVLCSRAKAVAFIKGGESYPDIVGSVLFYQTSDGVVVFAEIITVRPSTSSTEKRLVKNAETASPSLPNNGGKSPA